MPRLYITLHRIYYINSWRASLSLFSSVPQPNGPPREFVRRLTYTLIAHQTSAEHTKIPGGGEIKQSFIVSFNGQGQLCHLTCAEGRGLSNYNRMSTIESRRPGKKRKTPCKLDLKFPMKILFHYRPAVPFISSYDPKSFPKTFSHRNEAY